MMYPIPEIEERSPRLEKPARSAGKPMLISVLALICSLAALCLSVVGLMLAWPEPEPEPIPQEPETIQYITYGNHQIPVYEAVAVNAFETAAFASDGQGRLSYKSNGLTAIPGIDVSSHQKEIDWEQVAESGIEFAMIRAGYRGYGEEGKLVEDQQFRANMRGAAAAGLDIGVYFFSQATSIWEVEEELEFFLNLIEGYEITYPVVFDWEFIHTGGARTQNVTGESVSRMADFFCQEVTQAGYTPAVYFNKDLAYLHLDLERLKDYTFWLAEYDTAPDFYYHFDIWQYSCTGSVPGIQGNVDLNLAFADFALADTDET